MQLDLKLPRWLAALVFVLWTVALVQDIVCKHINLRANLHYLESGRSDPPPPYPGQPAMQRPKPEPPKPKEPDGEKRRPLRPWK